jgi:hypothetical protein
VCKDSNGVTTASGGSGQLNTSAPGIYAYTVTATSQDGQTAVASIAYLVVTETTPPDDPSDPPDDGGDLPVALELSLGIERRSLPKLLRTGKLVVAARVNEPAKLRLAGRAKLAVRVGRQTRTKLVTVFRGTARFVDPGRAKLTLALTRKGRRALRGLRKVRVAITGTATHSGGERARRIATLTLRRR